jgi:hypothetical protein
VYANVKGRQPKSDLFSRFWQQNKVVSFAHQILKLLQLSQQQEKLAKLIARGKLLISQQAVY